VSPDALAGPMNMLSDMLDDLFAGRFPSFSWRSLMNGKPRLTSCGASSKSSRNSISVPWRPGRAGDRRDQGQAADELKIGPIYGARLRLTGQVAINDEQFVLLGKGMLPNLVGNGVRGCFSSSGWRCAPPHTNLAVFVSLCVGFVVTAAAGLLMVGAFNLISVAFGILFIGLGADFCIQFTVRYRTEAPRA